ncbi:MAG TPA: hypothetical protein P5069_18565, partial [Candidatus Hydrogenedentes bacterium]|nr:hypothetical protein [Candidatus Hydrogenedentota bacterium]
IPLVNALAAMYLDPAGGAPDPALVKSVSQPLWWSLALGACLGGNGTLFGAAANVVVAQIARRNGAPFSFWTFLRFSLPVTAASLCISSLYIYVRYFVLSAAP